MQDELIEEGYKKALEILKKNITKMGFSASTERVANYYSIWARDHSICAIAAILSKDKELIEAAKKGVLLLLRKQADSGQVPSYVEIENKKKVYGGLGSITSIDSNMWIVIAAAFLHKKTKDKRFISDNNLMRYKRIYTLLKSFDSNNCGLIEVHRAGDWADVFNRTYHVLYDEVLYYQMLKDLMYLFKQGVIKTKTEDVIKKVDKRIRWISKRKPKAKRRINDSFWLTSDNIEKIYDDYMIYEKPASGIFSFYQSHLMPFKHTWAKRFDSFGNILAIATKIANKKRSNKIINHVIKNKINKPFPIMALSPVVFKNKKDWESIYLRKEKPYTYHNGGIWPMITGFWIYILNKNNKHNLAKKELYELAKNIQKYNWKFHEYFHGKTGKSMGKTQQAWSAAGYIIAYHSFNQNMALFDN